MVADDVVHAQHLKQAIQLLGPKWEVIHCMNGREALGQIGHHGQMFHLAVVDLGLPDMVGLDIIKAWRKRHAQQPLLVISLISSEQLVLDAIRAGANGYLLKDGDLQAMARGIDQVLRGQSPINPSLASYLFKWISSPAPSPGWQIPLTTKEKETLQHIAKGHSYLETANRMGVSLSTVQTHVRSLYRKLKVHSQMQAVVKARDHGLI